MPVRATATIKALREFVIGGCGKGRVVRYCHSTFGLNRDSGAIYPHSEYPQTWHLAHPSANSIDDRSRDTSDESLASVTFSNHTEPAFRRARRCAVSGATPGVPRAGVCRSSSC
jgi:hypothetical protein